MMSANYHLFSIPELKTCTLGLLEDSPPLGSHTPVFQKGWTDVIHQCILHVPASDSPLIGHCHSWAHCTAASTSEHSAVNVGVDSAT